VALSNTQVPADSSFVDCTSLREAAGRGHSGCLAALLHSSTAVASPAGELDNERTTVLHAVNHTACDCAAVTAALIAALTAQQQLSNAINLRDSSRHTALQWTVCHTPYSPGVCHSCLLLLLAAGAAAERCTLDSVLRDNRAVEQQKLSVQALVRSGLQLDGALHDYAADYRSPHAAEVLLACGADAMEVHAGDTPLHRAVFLDRPGTASHEADELHIGDCPTSCSAIQALYDSAGAACLTAVTTARMLNGGSNTPLHMATEWPKHVELLLQLGADVNAVTEIGRTPLHCAVTYGHLLSLQLLLKAGADTEMRNFGSGSTPLLLAAWYCRSKYLQMLLEAGADISARTHDGESVAVRVLKNAMAYNYCTAAPSLLDPRLACVLALERAGLDWSLRCLAGDPLLYYAVKSGNVAVVRHLLHAVLPTAPGAVNSRCTDGSGDTALHAAAEACSVELVQLLLRSGASPSLHVVDYGGHTPLRSCVERTDSSSSSTFAAEQAAVVQLLLEAGASATELDAYGYVCTNTSCITLYYSNISNLM
jgi:ankyrin repeat protein